MASFDEVIPPGQVGQVTAKLDTHKLHGAVGRGITVRTDDPARPTLFLTVRADIVGGVTVLPEEVLHVNNSVSGAAGGTVVLTPGEGEAGTLAVANVRVSVPWLAVEAKPVGELTPGTGAVPTARPGDWTIRVSAREGAPWGRQRAELSFATGLASQRELTLPVLIFLDPPVRVSTERLTLPATADGASQTVLVTVRPGLDPAALEIETHPEALATRLEPSGPRGFKLHVSWSGQGKPDGEIVFRIGSESYRLPVDSGAGSS